MTTLSFQEKYDAMGRKDAAFEGIFITAVKTTGIFCRPTCRAKKPNPENVIFYKSTQEALQHGFRPCKICKPLENLDETPISIQQIIKDLHQDPFLRLKDEDLRQRNIDPVYIRRWFQKHHNQMSISVLMAQPLCAGVRAARTHWPSHLPVTCSGPANDSRATDAPLVSVTS